MRPLHIVGQRNLDPVRAADNSKYDIVVAEKQKTYSPAGKLETVVFLRRVPRESLDMAGSAKTARNAQRAISLIKAKLAAKGLSPKKSKS